MSTLLTMPDHGHGTTKQPVVTLDPGTRTFTIDPAYLFMAGVWRVGLRFFADPSDALPVDQATFHFCIEG